MKQEKQFTAKTVEEAIALAGKEFGIEAKDVKYDILEEGKKGILGIGAKDAVIVAYKETNESVENAVNFITTLIENLGLEGLTVTTRPGDNDDTVIAVDGESAGLLIGHHGDTMDALQYLTQLIANRRTERGSADHVRVTLDIESYREKRAETLRALARRMAGKVLKEKKSVMLEPMNPYERRIIHSEIQGIAGVSTNSIGADNNRRVVLFLDEEKQ